MKEFEIVIKEVLSRVVNVEAESVDDAKEKARDMYYAEDVILGSEDFECRKMRKINENESDEVLF